MLPVYCLGGRETFVQSCRPTATTWIEGRHGQADNNMGFEGVRDIFLPEQESSTVNVLHPTRPDLLGQ